MNKKQRTSFLWSYFTIADPTNCTAKCEICGKIQSYKTTVSNLRKHIERRHPDIILPIPKSQIKELSVIDCSTSNSTGMIIPEQTLIENPNPSQSIEVINTYVNIESSNTDCSASTSPCKKKSGSSPPSIKTLIPPSKNLIDGQKMKLDKLLLDMFSIDYQPFSIVEDVGFSNFVRVLNSGYELPNRKTISNSMIPAEYETCLATMRRHVLSVESVTLATDTWTSAKAENYLGVTAIFINSNYELQSVLLECSVMRSLHTSSNIADEIKKIIGKFQLSDKVICVVSDNASNIDGAINELRLKHFPCFAHTLNLVLQDALKIPQDLIERVKIIVEFFKRSTTGAEQLQSVQSSMGLEPKKLIQEAPIRWNSTFYMLRRIAELKEAVKTAIGLMNEDLPILTEDEWIICSELAVALQPFEEVSRNCGEHYLTGSQVIPITIALNSVLNKMNIEKFHSLTKSVVSELIKGLKNRMNNIEKNRTIALATLLDPRFKLAVFSDAAAAEEIKRHCTELMGAVWLRNNELKKIIPDIEEETNKEDRQLPKFSVWEDIDKMISSKKPSGQKTSAALVEINRYLGEDCIGLKEDPLNWWKSNQTIYPLMSTIVKKKYCVVATSTPCKRLFSKAAYVMTERRTRLSAKHAEQIIFINSNKYLI